MLDMLRKRKIAPLNTTIGSMDTRASRCVTQGDAIGDKTAAIAYGSTLTFNKKLACGALRERTRKFSQLTNSFVNDENIPLGSQTRRILPWNLYQS